MWDLRNVEGSEDAEANTWKLETVVLVAHRGIDELRWDLNTPNG